MKAENRTTFFRPGRCTGLRWLISLAFVNLAWLSASADILLSAESPEGVQVELKLAGERVIVGEPQTWQLSLRNVDGSPVVPVSIAFQGGMPAHGHGLPETATVRATPWPGVYEVEPVTLNMGGDWLFIVSVGSPERMEEYRFELFVEDSGGGAEDLAGGSSAALLQTLTLSALPGIEDPTNRFSGDPAAIALGRKLFFSTKLSSNGEISCATCHQPKRAFTDGRVTSEGIGATQRNAMTLVGVGHGRWFYSDGRRDSLWAQALVPLETRTEMNTTRSDVVRLLLSEAEFAGDYLKLTNTVDAQSLLTQIPADSGPFAESAGRSRWQALSGAARFTINSHFANAGKIIAAFEETLQPSASRFDQFVAMLEHQHHAAQILNDQERAGLALFLDTQKTQCLHCHNGPMFTNQGFHAIGSESSFLDLGFYVGLQSAQLDEFNCTGRFSDDDSACLIDQMRSVDLSHYSLAFKVPTLRELSKTGPYFHDGRFSTLEEVIAFYRSPPAAAIESGELSPLDLSDDEAAALIAFLLSLSSDD